MKYRIMKQERNGDTKYFPQYKMKYWPFWLHIKKPYPDDDYVVGETTSYAAEVRIDKHKRLHGPVKTTYIPY